jgi:hypothetical protein
MVGNSDDCMRGLEHMANLGIEFGVEEIVVWIFFAERVTCQQCLRSWTFGRIPAFSVSTNEATRRGTCGATYTVKQSYIKARAAGLIAMETSSGIGGA